MSSISWRSWKCWCCLLSFYVLCTVCIEENPVEAVCVPLVLRFTKALESNDFAPLRIKLQNGTNALTVRYRIIWERNYFSKSITWAHRGIDCRDYCCWWVWLSTRSVHFNCNDPECWPFASPGYCCNPLSGCNRESVACVASAYLFLSRSKHFQSSDFFRWVNWSFLVADLDAR